MNKKVIILVTPFEKVERYCFEYTKSVNDRGKTREEDDLSQNVINKCSFFLANSKRLQLYYDYYYYLMVKMFFKLN